MRKLTVNEVERVLKEHGIPSGRACITHRHIINMIEAGLVICDSEADERVVAEDVPPGLILNPRTTDTHPQTWLAWGADVMPLKDDPTWAWYYRPAGGTTGWRRVEGIGAPGTEEIVQVKRELKTELIPWHRAAGRLWRNKMGNVKRIDRVQHDARRDPTLVGGTGDDAWFYPVTSEDGTVEVMVDDARSW